jgi:hypothetical protein
MGADCSVISNKTLDEFTALQNREGSGHSGIIAHSQP